MNLNRLHRRIKQTYEYSKTYTEKMDIVCKILYDITVYTKIIGTLEKWNFHKVGFKTNPVSKIVEKTVCMSVFLATWHCNLSAAGQRNFLLAKSPEFHLSRVYCIWTVFRSYPYPPVGKIAENVVCRSVFLTIWHCNLSPSECFFSDAHWDDVPLF